MLAVRGAAVFGIGALAWEGPARGGVEAVQDGPKDAARPESPPPTLRERFEATRKELDARERSFNAARTEAERETIRQAKGGFYRSVGQLLDLAAADPHDPLARDVVLWTLHPGRGNEDDRDPWSQIMGRAIDLLLRHYANDPAAARAALALVESRDRVSRNRDRLTRGLYERATARDAKGIASLALAEYLEIKAGAVEHKDKPNWGKSYAMMDDGRGGVKKVELPNPNDDAYVGHLRSCDSRVLRQEAEGLYRRITEEFADVPYVEPSRRGDSPRSRRQTLGDVSGSRLDRMRTLAIGKPAPEIEGTDLDGVPRKLSEYRGKVVVLVFWGSWCVPCLREVPHERELAERLKGRPFAILGVNCEEDQAAARRTMAREHIDWPNWHDGPAGDGPIARDYHVEGFPATFVIDARGIIRFKNVLGEGLDQAVEILMRDEGSR